MKDKKLVGEGRKRRRRRVEEEKEREGAYLKLPVDSGVVAAVGSARADE